MKYRKFELSDKEALIFFVSNLPIPHSGLQAQSCPWLVDDDRETTAFTTREGLKGCGSFYRVFADESQGKCKLLQRSFYLIRGEGWHKKGSKQDHALQHWSIKSSVTQIKSLLRTIFLLSSLRK